MLPNMPKVDGQDSSPVLEAGSYPRLNCVLGLTELIDLLAETQRIGGAEYGRMITFRSKSLELQENMCLLFDRIEEFVSYWKRDTFRERLDSYRNWFQQHDSDQGKSVLVP